MSLTAEQTSALEATFKAIAPARTERWLYLLNLPASRWNKISPIDGWPLKSEYDSYPNEPIAALLRKPPLKSHLNSNVLVLRCGYSKNPGLVTMTLKDVFPNGEWSDYEALYEGFVCIVPGKLAIAANHEGGLYVLGA